MTSFAASSVRLLRRLFAAERAAQASSAGTPAVLDGASAIASVEARISDAATLHATYPGSAAVRGWLRQERSRQLGVFDQMLTSLEAPNTRGALSSALGLTLAGQRTAAFASGADLAGAADLLTRAAGLHLPLVVHLVSRGVPRQGTTLGGGHEAYHLVAETGALCWFATNVQEAVDLTLIARRVAEEALVPVLIAQDGSECAAAAQDLLLPESSFLRDFVGDASARIDTPTPAQRFVFGEARRRLPRRHDLDLPMLSGPTQGGESFALGAAAHTYSEREAAAAMKKAVDAFESMTGRRYDPVVRHRTDDAEVLLVVQGATYELAVAVAEELRQQEKRKVGVLGVRFLRPLAGEEIAKACRGAKIIVVLERLPLAASAGPLLREVQSACVDAEVRGRFVDVSCGVGGLPVRAADLAHLVRMLPTTTEKRLHLGLDFLQKTSKYPKRQAYLDALRGEATNLQRQAVRADGCLDVQPHGSVAFGLLRPAGEHESLAGDLAQLLHALAGGHLRSRPGVSLLRGEASCIDALLWSSDALHDVGDEVLFDVLVASAVLTAQDAEALLRMKEGGTLVLVRRAGEEQAIVLPRKVADALAARRLSVRCVTTASGVGAVEEAVLAGGIAALADFAEAFAVDVKKLSSRREEALADLAGAPRAARLEALRSAFQSCAPLDPSTCEMATGQAAASPSSPLLRRFGRSVQTLDAVPRFFDQTAVLYRDGRTDELIADPCASFASLPPVTSTFRSGLMPAQLVAFDPATCDGNGRLWTSCPDGSILPVVISAKAVLDVAMELAAAKGKPVDALRPLLNKLAKQINRIVSQSQSPPTTARELMQQALAALAGKEGEAPADQQQALAALIEEIGDLPLARTAPFFDDAEQQAKGSGELLSLIVNPAACRAPEYLACACKGRGLKLVPRIAANIAAAQRLCELFERLPDVPANTIERLRTHAQVGPLAAIALSRHCAQTLLAGDGAEPASGAKLALRHVLTLAEYHLQPRLQKFLEELERCREELARAIRTLLADALPTRDLEALAQGLEALDREEADLAGLIERVEAASAAPAVDSARLRRLVDLARRLADLRWKIEQGPDGLGRARVGVALAAGTAAWAGVYPYNPFLVPVSSDASGEAVGLARGLAEGQFQQVLAALRLLRWAKLEIEKPREAPHEAPKLAGLAYADLTDEERQICPPLVLVGDGRSLATAELSQLLDALGDELPLKVVLLCDAAGAAGTSFGVEALDPAPDRERLDAGLLAMLGRRAYVAQGSLADSTHLATAFTGALVFAGPALVQIHAPSPQRHGFAPEHMLEQTQLALRSRAWPLFAFDPSREGVFGSCLSLEANPSVREVLSATEARTLTPVDWAVTEERFADHFVPLAESDPQPTPVQEYLLLGARERRGCTPFVERTQGEEPQRLRVSARLIRDADERLRFWRVLQELSGVVTPFTEKVRREAEGELEADQQRRLDELKREYEAKLTAAASEHEADAVNRLKQQLLSMAGIPSGSRRNGGGA